MHAADGLLGSIGDTRTVGPLIGALKDEYKYVRIAAAESLSYVNQPEVIEPLLEALHDSDSVVRMYAIYGLGRTLHEPRAIEPLCTALYDVDEYVRGIAARNLGYLGGARAVEALWEAVWDESRGIQADAVIGLGMLGVLGNPPIFDSLLAQLEGDSQDKYAVALALGYLGDVRAVEPLLAVLNDQENRLARAVPQPRR